jgi:hypothetical protein
MGQKISKAFFDADYFHRGIIKRETIQLFTRVALHSINRVGIGTV